MERRLRFIARLWVIYTAKSTETKHSKKRIIAYVLIAFFLISLLIFIGLAILGSLLSGYTYPTYVSYNRLNLSGTEGLIVKITMHNVPKVSGNNNVKTGLLLNVQDANQIRKYNPYFKTPTSLQILSVGGYGIANFSILTVQQYANFSSNESYTTVYSKNVNASDVIFLSNLTRGDYYPLLLSISPNVTFNFLPVTPTVYKFINGTGILNFTINNVSNVNLTAVSTYPAKILLLEGNESQLLINITQENISDIWWVPMRLNAGDYAIEFNANKNNTGFVSINITPDKNLTN